MVDCKDCYWSNAETCRICNHQKSFIHLSDAVKEANEKGFITTYAATRLEGNWKQILEKINGEIE